MKVRIKVTGMTEPLTGFEDRKEVQVDFSGNTVKDLLHHLSLGIGPKQKEIFLNNQGEIPWMLSVCINGSFPMYSDRITVGLRDDDFIELFFHSGG